MCGTCPIPWSVSTGRVYLPLLRRLYRRAYERVDAVMSVVDPSADAGRAATIPLRLGLDPAFRPAPAVRGDHLLYVGRIALDKRIPDLLAAIARAPRPRPLWIAGDGPARGSVLACADRLGLNALVRFLPFVRGRERLAALSARLSWPAVLAAELADLERIAR